MAFIPIWSSLENLLSRAVSHVMRSSRDIETFHIHIFSSNHYNSLLSETNVNGYYFGRFLSCSSF